MMQILLCVCRMCACTCVRIPGTSVHVPGQEGGVHMEMHVSTAERMASHVPSLTFTPEA